MDGDEARNWDQVNARRIELVEKEIDKGLTADEAAELSRLQTDYFKHLEQVHPLPPVDMEQLERIEAEIKAGKE